MTRINVPLDSHVGFGAELQIIKHTYAFCMKHCKSTIRNMATMRYFEDISDKYTSATSQSVFNVSPNKVVSL
jgi:hypothetical protein